MIDEAVDKITRSGDFPVLTAAGIAGYLIADKTGAIKQSKSRAGDDIGWLDRILKTLPDQDNQFSGCGSAGAFYKITDPREYSGSGPGSRALFVGPVPESDDKIAIVFDIDASFKEISDKNSELIILSLITQAVRAFNRATDVKTILKIVLIGVTAGCGLGFNRAFILLTCDENNCLKGALANGPASPEEANAIWEKLSNGEITLEKMFDEALKNGHDENHTLNGFLKDIVIPLDNKDNLFVRAALEKRSMIIDRMALAAELKFELHSMIGPGPLAVVPLIGQDYLQGVLIADNFITRKKITDNDLKLLEIFARYASDSIKNFRLYEHLGKKVDALKHANETIINSRENVIKAERLSVLAEMAGEVAHEIRNPLTVIGGFAKSMLKKMSPGEANYENLQIIFNQVERISRSLEQFTSLINYESLQNRVCNLAELVRSAVEVRIPGISFSKFKVESDDIINVTTDPDLLRQAFIIILKHVNSINDEALPVNLSITRNRGRAVVFFGTDSDADTLAGDIYQSFHKGGNHEKLKHLSTTLEILKYYNGNIGIEANEYGRKRFYVELPLSEEDK